MSYDSKLRLAEFDNKVEISARRASPVFRVHMIRSFVKHFSDESERVSCAFIFSDASCGVDCHGLS